MVASIEPTVRVKVRDKLRVAMRPSRLHVFDAKDRGGNLTPVDGGLCFTAIEEERLRRRDFIALVVVPW